MFSKESAGALRRYPAGEVIAGQIGITKNEAYMHMRNVPRIAAILLLAGCTVATQNNDDDIYEVGNISETVASLAAPGQDLASARLRHEDGCYWYEHSGPVETTLVPLRAVGGGPICRSPQP